MESMGNAGLGSFGKSRFGALPSRGRAAWVRLVKHRQEARLGSFGNSLSTGPTDMRSVLPVGPDFDACDFGAREFAGLSRRIPGAEKPR